MSWRTETVTRQVPEFIKGIDWSYDFKKHSWDQGGSCNPDTVKRSVKFLKQLEKGLNKEECWEATDDGGCPRVGWGKVLDVGVYGDDPAVLVESWMFGSRILHWHMIDIRRVEK